MSFETSIALRYLVASRRRAHVALISTISMLGLAVGVAALVISLSLLSGFQDRIRAQMAQRTPHLRVSPTRGAVLPDPERVHQALSSLNEHRVVQRVLGLAFDVALPAPLQGSDRRAAAPLPDLEPDRSGRARGCARAIAHRRGTRRRLFLLRALQQRLPRHVRHDAIGTVCADAPSRCPLCVASLT